MKHFRYCGAAGTALILILFVLSCGCGDYVPNHDVIVIGLNPDGTQAWSRTLDEGYDDVASDIVETSEGNLVIAAGSGSRQYESPVPKLIRLGRDGTLISEIPCPSMTFDLTSLVRAGEGTFAASNLNGKVGFFDQNGNLVSVTETGMNGVWSLAVAPAGGIAVAGQSWEQYPAGSIAEYDENGTVSTRAPLASETVETPGCRETVLEAGDRKIPVTECVAPMRSASQAAVTLLDRNGSIAWQRGYGAYGLESFWSIAAPGDGSGYYLGAFGPREDGSRHRYAARISGSGSIEWVTDLGPATLSYPSQWDTRQDRIRMIFSGEYTQADGSVTVRPEAVEFDSDGKIIARQEIAGSRIITPTSDGGFFSAGIATGHEPAAYSAMSGYAGGDLHALKLRDDGSVDWDRVVGDGTADTVRKVIQTADGGFIILAERQNR
ncbi:MAG: hypothetical protein M0Q92_13795 [Methanoregula sp.]|jgi:hypothetical protein|nr:hypothetical protein [Methanoregula sp.]